MTAGLGADFESSRIRKRGTSPHVVESRETPKGSLLSEIFASLEDSTLLSFFFIYEND